MRAVRALAGHTAAPCALAMCPLGDTQLSGGGRALLERLVSARQARPPRTWPNTCAAPPRFSRECSAGTHKRLESLVVCTETTRGILVLCIGLGLGIGTLLTAYPGTTCKKQPDAVMY